MRRPHTIFRSRPPRAERLPIPTAGDVVKLAGFLDGHGEVVVLRVHDVRHLRGVALTVTGRSDALVVLEVLRAASYAGYERAKGRIPLRKLQPLDLRDVDGYGERADLSAEASR